MIQRKRFWHKSHAKNMSGPTKTQQNFKADCDINNLIERYVPSKSSSIGHKDVNYERFVDLTVVGSFQEMQNKTIMAREEFEKIDPKIRRALNNDVDRFMDYALNPRNHDHMRKIGLLPPLKDKPTEGRKHVRKFVGELVQQLKTEGWKAPESDVGAEPHTNT